MIKKRSFGSTLQGKSIQAYLKEKLEPTGSLSHLGVKSVVRFERWRYPANKEEIDLLLPQVVIAFGGWKSKEIILNGIAIQGYNQFLITLLTPSSIDEPDGPESTEIVEEIAAEFIQQKDLLAPHGLWSPDPNADPSSLAYKQYASGIEITSVFPTEIYPISLTDIVGIDVDQQAFPLAIAGDSYQR